MQKVAVSEKTEMIEEALKFWFRDHDHVRSPFPESNQDEVKKVAIERFDTWINQLNEKAKDELNDEMMAEKFEEVLFESALSLVKDEDVEISLLYPFLPRIGDEVKGGTGLLSLVMKRKLSKSGDHKFLDLEMKELENDRLWETQIELPA